MIETSLKSLLSTKTVEVNATRWLPLSGSVGKSGTSIELGQSDDLKFLIRICNGSSTVIVLKKLQIDIKISRQERRSGSAR